MPTQGYRLPVAAAWPFLGAPVGAGAPTLTPLTLPVSVPVAQAPQSAVPGGATATSASAAHAAAAAAAAAAATPIVLAPRPPHSAVPTAAPTAATPRRRYDDNNKCPRKVSGESARLKAEFKSHNFENYCQVYRKRVFF